MIWLVHTVIEKKTNLNAFQLDDLTGFTKQSPSTDTGGVRVRGEWCGRESNTWGTNNHNRSPWRNLRWSLPPPDSMTIKLRVAEVTGVLLLLPVMLSKPFQRVRFRTVCGLSATNTQVEREWYALFKDKNIMGFIVLQATVEKSAKTCYMEDKVGWKLTG